MAVGTALALIGAASAVAGTAIAAKGLSNSEKAAKAAASAKPPQVNIADTQAQAQQIAAQNAANSAALEAQYNPGAAELRAGGLQSLLAALNDPNTDRNELASRIMAQAGQPLSSVNAPTAQQFDSALTRQAVEAAARDLALGGQLPQDVRNLVARGALAKSGTVTGGLQLGRDLTTRDLGLTSLDLYNKRLQNAAAIAQQEAALGQANAALRAQNDSLGLQAAGMNLQSEQFGRTNLLNSASFLDQLSSGDFARAFQAAQLGQNIAQPASGLDPGSVANIAIGNQNAAAGQQQNASALAAGVGNQQAAFGSQLAGTGIGLASQFYRPTTYSYTSPTTYGATNYVPPATSYASQLPAVYCWVARAVFGEDNPEWMQFRDWLLTEGSMDFVDFYGQNGPAIAEEIKDMPAVKTLIKHLMVAAKGGAK